MEASLVEYAGKSTHIVQAARMPSEALLLFVEACARQQARADHEREGAKREPTKH